MSPIELPMAPSTPPAELPPASERERAAPANGRRFRVEGMDCAACAKTIEKIVAAVDGVAAAGLVRRRHAGRRRRHARSRDRRSGQPRRLSCAAG
jgi:Heavy-metal-associated domain